MSPNQNNNHDQQCNFKKTRHDSLISHKLTLHKNGLSHQSRKLSSIAYSAMLLGSTSLILAGCQLSPTASSSTAASHNMLDFSITDTAQNQAQGRAFNDALSAKSAHYDQLFNQEKHPNTENQAKSHLLTAIRQHLATEHVAVAQANYHAAPFIDPDSIDAGASSLLRTIIETYAYQSALESDDDEYSESSYDENGYDYTDVDHADEVVIVEESTSESATEDDYDGVAYDGVTEEAYEDANEYEAAAIATALEEAGENDESLYGDDDNYHDDDNYDDDDDNEEDSDNDDRRNRILSGMSGLKPKGLLRNYEAMQMAKQQPKTVSEEYEEPTVTVDQILNMFHRTPEQIAASNAYQYKNLTFNSVSHYQPKKRQLQSVYSYDYVTPTIGSSIQIPLAFDFNNSRITVDPSAIMPIVALVNPENTPLPNQMASHTVSFGLPDAITSQLPPAVLYDAVISAIQNSMAELSPDYFSAVDIRQDPFAKEVGASHAVKVYFGSQQSGEMIGKVLKYMTQSLQSYVDANPEKYPDGAVLKAALDKAALYNKGYQSQDVGALLQLIEAIGPLSFNQINYYYLDSSDRLLAKQQRMNIGGDLLGATTTVLNQVRYDKASFNNHVLTPLLAESFGENAKPAIDGNAWMADQRQQEDRLATARYARYDYHDSRFDDERDNEDANYNDTDSDDDTDNSIEIQ
ncbi:hypothetical protein AAJP47_09875 [Psychrobacter sp. B38]|uniref:hypothetical protein n=1 Tax=Psychrobacter sp. B38 TaxID=3143538 RepID=UPI0032108656